MDSTIPQENPQKQPPSKERIAQYSKKYRETHREHANARAREWRAANKERVAQNNKAYNEAHKERLIQDSKARHEANREQHNQKTRKYYQDHQETLLQKAKAYRETHREEMKAYQETYRERRRIVNLVRRYGISIEEWNTLYQQQNGCCAICNHTLNGCEDTVVDHCHKTGVVRGLLCGKCNNGIGMLNDSADVLLSAYQYLCKWTVQTQELK